MPTPLGMLAGDKRLLLAVAAPREADAVAAGIGLAIPSAVPEWRLLGAAGGFDLLLTGVGKANAAGAVARLLDPARHAGVISLGIAGALPGADLGLGACVVATSCVFADEGLSTPDGFRELSTRGFPPGPWPGPSSHTDPQLLAALLPMADRTGAIATVSTCSATDALALDVARRTGAIAEAMEGAAVAASSARLGVPWAELRVISNTTGSDQRWDLPSALARLRDVAARLG